MNRIKIVSRSPHLSGVISGFLMLREQGLLDFKIDLVYEQSNLYPHLALVEAEIEGVKIAFDVKDGYNFDAEKVDAYLRTVDFYFKRSFSEEKNAALVAPENRQKMHPLGFNYHLSYPGNPLDRFSFRDFKLSAWQILKPLIGRKHQRYFTPEVFEAPADYKEDAPEIIFLTRLWPLTEETVGLHDYINETRIAIIRELSKKYGEKFTGGVSDSALSRALCPDLILPKSVTVREKYLPLMKRSDICIGSMGLRESIGWKTGEYIAASRAIVHERFHYSVPGDFTIGKHYFDFDTVDECVTHVDYLYQNQDALFAMKQANQEYYQEWLRPDKQVLNALETALDKKPGD